MYQQQRHMLLFSLLCILLCLHSSVHGQSTATAPAADATGQNCTFSGAGHCPSGFVCLKSLCARRCFFMGGCPTGFKCQGNFACVKTFCPASDLGCCSHCPETCSKPADCPQGWGCLARKCRRVECQSNSDCEFSWPCLMGKCHSKICAKDSDCPEKWSCGTSRRCTKSTTKKN